MSDKATTSAIVEILPDGIDLVNANDDAELWDSLFAVDGKIIEGLLQLNREVWRVSVKATEDYVDSVLHDEAARPRGYVCMGCGAVYDHQPGQCSTCGAGAARVIYWGDV